MRSLRAAALALAIALPVAPAAVRAAESGAVAVDRILAALGGRGALAAAHEVRREGTLIEPDGTPRPLTIVTRGRSAEILPGGAPGERWAVEGGFGYRVDADGRSEPITDASLGPLVLQGTSAALPWILLDGREVVTAEAGGTIVVTLSPRLILRVNVDPATLLVSSFTLAPPDSAEGTMRAELQDYREVNGIRIPFVEALSIDEHPVGSYRVTRAAVAPAPAPSAGHPVGGGQ